MSLDQLKLSDLFLESSARLNVNFFQVTVDWFDWFGLIVEWLLAGALGDGVDNRVKLLTSIRRIHRPVSRSKVQSFAEVETLACHW